MSGRPLKFKTKKELQNKIDEYFAMCRETGTPEAITGLALALDTTRETLLDYEHREEFSYTIKKAKAMIEYAYELRAIKRGTSFDIFALKNFGWRDRQEVDIGQNKAFEVNIRVVDDTE